MRAAFNPEVSSSTPHCSFGSIAVKAASQVMSPTCAPRPLPSGRLMEELAGGAGVGGEDEGTIPDQDTGKAGGVWGMQAGWVLQRGGETGRCLHHH